MEIKPQLLDIIKEHEQFVIYYDGQPLKTPSGSILADGNQRLLEYILRDLALSRELADDQLNAATLFDALQHFEDVLRPGVEQNFEALLDADPIVRRKQANGESKPHDTEQLTGFLEESDQLPFIFTGLRDALESLNEFTTSYGGTTGYSAFSNEAFRTMLRDAFEALLPERQLAVVSLCFAHDAGFTLPLLLVTQFISTTEYVNALFSMHLPGLRTNSYKVEQSGLPCNLPDWEHPADSFEKMVRQTGCVLEFVYACGHRRGRDRDLRRLIANGEDGTVEFKSTLRWNLKGERKDPKIEHAALKTVNAFLNSEGGTLLVGVRDDGSIEGIETDLFSNEDKCALHFWNLLKSSMGQDAGACVNTSFHRMAGKTVFMIECRPSTRPVFFKQSGFDEEFYVRTGPASAALSIREAIAYISTRFNGDQPEAPPLPESKQISTQKAET